MAATQEHSYTTNCNAIHYTFRSTENRRRNVVVPTTPAHRVRCTLVVASVADGEPLRIPCYYCSGFPRDDDYCEFYNQQLTILLQFHSPFIPDCCAAKIADTLTNTVLLPAHDALHCPYHPLEGNDAAFTTFHRVEIDVWPVARGPEEVGPEIALESGLECAICLEGIETQSSALKMPCSHVFHKACLAEWLNNSNVCPLCRYEIPYED